MEQQGGDGQTDIQGIDGGFSQYLRLYWEPRSCRPTKRSSPGATSAFPDMNKQTLVVEQRRSRQSMYYRVFFQVGHGQRVPAPDHRRAAGRAGSDRATLKATIQQYRAEARFLRALSYWHGIDLFGNIPLVTEADPARRDAAAAERPARRSTTSW